MRTLWDYYHSSGLGYVRIPCSLEDYLRESVAEETQIKDAAARGSAIEFLAQLIVEVVKQHPEELFAATQAHLYLQSGKTAFPESSRLPPNRVRPDQLVRILRPVLNSGVSLSDVKTILDHIRQVVAIGLSDDDIGESLIPLLRADCRAPNAER